ncbi:MAG: ubiquitin-like domain-containing protein [Anaerolineales bacterium]|nr:ubiquitin-like domain-containing protein [Anaerolineales bacterium]
MKLFRWLALWLILILSACQLNNQAPITILDGNNILKIESSERVPLILLTEAGIAPQPKDRVLFNGSAVPMDQPITTNNPIQLQLRRAVTLTLVTPQGEQIIQTSALTVGQALNEAGYSLNVNDNINPPAETAITDSLTVTYTPARDLVIYSGDDVINIRSAAGTVAEALAEAGIPLMGLDTSSPLENEALPADGQIRVVRVYESISIALEPIAFDVEVIDSPEVPFGQQETIQPGLNGLAMVRTRIRFEDGKEVSSETEDGTILREPQTRILAGGSKIVLAPVGGEVPYQYWYATEMYASWYSPCNSGTGGCSYGTASGARAGYGIVAVDYSIYSYLAGMKVYIPGYGLATIGDTGGGPIIETAFGVPRTKWIDLGYNDDALGKLSGWVTVYFLAPAPAEIPYFLK